MTQPTIRQRLLGLGATLAILLLVAGIPVVLVALGATPWRADLGDLRTLLSSPDDGTLAVVVIAAVAWIAWLVVAVSVVVEVLAQVRGLPAPTLPGLGAPQRAAGELVAVAALLFVAAPTVAAGFPAPPAHAAAAPLRAAPVPAAVETAAVPSVAAPVPAAAGTSPKERSTVDYTVKRGDSLWRIADQLLGDGARFPEIVELNHAVLNGRPDFILAGTVLKVPHEADEPAGDSPPGGYAVKPGDTLSGIAEAELGDPARYGELAEASRGTVQSDGSRLTDPNLIRPGWEITIPGPANRVADVPDKPVDVGPPAPAAPPPVTPRPEPALTPTPAKTAPPEPAPAADHADGNSEAEASTPGWLLPGLTGSGAVLAAVVLLAVRAHRNTQLRYRRPGQRVAAPPPELRNVEKTAFASGAPLTDAIKHLDRALRHLAGACEDESRTLPPAVTVTLARDIATLHLATDADLPAPWTGEGAEWSTLLGTDVPDRPDVLPPYPMLVSVGQDGSGALHLVNLEHLRVTNLAGDSNATTALGRHIAAELALNPWAVLVDVTVIGLGEELAPLDPLRLHHHVNDDGVVASIARDLTAAREAGGDDPDPYRAVVTAGPGTAELADLLASPVPRLGAAVISLGAPVPGSTLIEIDHDGHLHAPSLRRNLQAAGLMADEAAACAAIVDLTRESEPERIPPFDEAAGSWKALADHAGLLRAEVTDPRGTDPAGNESLLPRSTEEYVEVAATTAADVETLAPVVPASVRRKVEDADPALDEDVAEWFDPDSVRPRLTVLGPVKAYVFGETVPAIAKRRPYFVEMLAYLALHPGGVTGGAVSDAFSTAASRARTDLGILRTWLGTNPRTGTPHLPAANESATFRETGVKAYQVEDVLVDADLFRRLRARGEARGAEGIADLKTATTLVAGQPFSLLRERGWSWLLDDERLHETIGCAIVDTAHILVVDALEKNDLPAAREAAETACTAAPYDEICRLDLVKVTAAEGHEEAAEKMLADGVVNRTDDHLPPVTLPERTSAALDGDAPDGRTTPHRK
ncbi:LysM peptidoglycan-binding domain-containing protein [Mumia zhuanghuii]|uniref:LysM peptidoglycan-binding domain-containing protein n=1 Tax=Mumia zhuanghuii TaxID=2585211 RepID=UPI003644603C